MPTQEWPETLLPRGIRHQLLQYLDSLLTRLVHRPPGLLTILISPLPCVGEELLTLLLGVVRRLVDCRLGFSAHRGQFGVVLFVGFLILGV